MSDRQQDRVWQRRVEHRLLADNPHLEAEGIELHADMGATRWCGTVEATVVVGIVLEVLDRV